jgi:adenylate cyclase
VNIDNFFAELKRRNVYKVAVAYIVAGWALAQGIAQVLPVFDAPNWLIRLLVVLIIIGLPIALAMAWAFELTPEGLKRTEAADVAPSRRSKDQAWIYIVVIAGVISIGLFFLGRYTAQRASAAKNGWLSPTAGSLPEKSVAVLPFVNMSSDQENTYFVDGLTEEILNRVAEIGGLKVPGRTSSFAFKNQNRDLRQIGATLGVSHVLEGSVRKAGDRLRITVQLVRTADGFHLWSQSYDRKLDDVFAIQEEIARAVAGGLSLQLKLQPQIAQQPTRDMAAYNDYLEARGLIAQRDSEKLQRAIGLLQSATQRDAQFAKAWGALAQAQALIPYYRRVRVSDAEELAEAAARKALTIDDSLAAAHSALADVLRDRLDWANSEREYQHALELSPGEAEIHNQYAQMLMRVGHMDSALEHGNRASELDPLAWVPPSIVAIVHLSRGEFDQTHEFLARSEKLVAQPIGFQILAKLLYALSTHDAALSQQTIQTLAARRSSSHEVANQDDRKLLEIAEQALRAFNSDPHSVPDLGRAFTDARRNGASHFLFLPFAAVAAAVNQRDVALDVFEEELRSPYLFDISLIWVPVFRPLRGEPRFKELLIKTKMPQYWRTAGWGEFCHAKGANDFECVVQ